MKTAKEIGKNIILNPQMIAWNYYAPYHLTKAKIEEYGDITLLVHETHTKLVGAIAFAYQNGIINNKEVLILCNKIDVSGESFKKRSIREITENTDFLLQMYKCLDTVALMVSQTKTPEDFRKILQTGGKDRKNRKLMKRLRKIPEYTLWDIYKSSIREYMEEFRKRFISPEECDLRFSFSPCERSISKYETEYKEMDKTIKNFIISILDMPLEARNYYSYQKECGNVILGQKDLPEDTKEKISHMVHTADIFESAANKKLNNDDDLSIIRYVAGHLQTL